MNVVLAIGGQVVVDNQRHLLDVNAASQQICRYENAGGPGAELSHDDVALFLVHVSVLKSYKDYF